MSFQARFFVVPDSLINASFAAKRPAKCGAENLYFWAYSISSSLKTWKRKPSPQRLIAFWIRSISLMSVPIPKTIIFPLRFDALDHLSYGRFKPANTAREMIAWPIFNSAIPGIRAIAWTLLYFRPCPPLTVIPNLSGKRGHFLNRSQLPRNLPFRSGEGIRPCVEFHDVHAGFPGFLTICASTGSMKRLTSIPAFVNATAAFLPAGNV